MNKLFCCFTIFSMLSIASTAMSKTSSLNDVYVTHNGEYITRREAMQYLSHGSLEPKDLIIVRDEDGEIIGIKNPSEYPHTHK
jgi:hypothetical protein